MGMKQNFFFGLFFSNEENLGFHMRYHFFEILMITLVSSQKSLPPNISAGSVPQPDLQSLLHSLFQGFAEDLSQFQDNSFDVVIETLVLCSVNDVDQSLREIHRVLKPGGIFCFLDHVKAPDSTWLLRFQNFLTATVSKGGNFFLGNERTFVRQCDENSKLLPIF